MTRAHRLGIAFAALVAAGLSGCAGNVVGSEELPDAPIAIVYRPPQEARERAETLAKRAGDAPKRTGSQGVMSLNSAAEYVDGLRGRQRERNPGRVALFFPRSGEVRVLDALIPGARPLAWSDDRERLLFASQRGGSLQLYEYDAGLAVVTRVTSGRHAHIQGDYGPDGRVAFVEVRRKAGAQAIISLWVTRPGGRPIQATLGPADVGPTWSRDGRWLLYETADERRGRVILALDMDDPEAEPRIVARGAEPAFTPDGDWVVYAREGRKGWRLWRMRPDGTGKTALGVRPQGQTDERAPTVSPDGRYVAYVAIEEHRQRLRVRRIDGSGDRPLPLDGDGAEPAW